MKMKRVIPDGHVKDESRGAETTRNLSGDERVSLLEELRRDTARVLWP